MESYHCTAPCFYYRAESGFSCPGVKNILFTAVTLCCSIEGVSFFGEQIRQISHGIPFFGFPSQKNSIVKHRVCFPHDEERRLAQGRTVCMK